MDWSRLIGMLFWAFDLMYFLSFHLPSFLWTILINSFILAASEILPPSPTCLWVAALMYYLSFCAYMYFLFIDMITTHNMLDLLHVTYGCLINEYFDAVSRLMTTESCSTESSLKPPSLLRVTCWLSSVYMSDLTTCIVNWYAWMLLWYTVMFQVPYNKGYNLWCMLILYRVLITTQKPMNFTCALIPERRMRCGILQPAVNFWWLIVLCKYMELSQ